MHKKGETVSALAWKFSRSYTKKICNHNAMVSKGSHRYKVA